MPPTKRSLPEPASPSKPAKQTKQAPLSPSYRQSTLPFCGSSHASTSSSSTSSSSTSSSSSSKPSLSSKPALPSKSPLSSKPAAPSVPSYSKSTEPSQRYWRPLVARVHNARDPTSPSATSLKLPSLFQSDLALRSAIVCSDYLEADLLFEILDKVGDKEGRASVLLIARKGGVKDMPKPQEMTQTSARRDVRVLEVEDGKSHESAGGGVFHMKFIILRYDTHLRVCISSANLKRSQWLHVDNSLWVIDFPSQPIMSASPPAKFCDHLKGVLQRLGVEPEWTDFLRQYDASATDGADGVRLVWSVPGRLDTGGLLCLSKAIKSFEFAPCRATGGQGHWVVEAQTSSLLSFPKNWLWTFLATVSGLGTSVDVGYSTKKRLAPLSSTDVPLGALKIGFPSETEPGSSIWNHEWLVKKQEQLRGLFYLQNCKRSRTISHSKTILALHKYDDPDAEGQAHEGWVYLGSHNFTSAAWGHNGSDGLKVGNHELGVVFPIRAKSAEELETKASALMSYKRPMELYDEDDLLYDKPDEGDKKKKGGWVR